ncbi:MAG: NUDIX hydrolase [Gammaproteobacteria bacterium]|nr:NUDIX hydrolase [Gammaproteobacteria bacterium]
MDERWRPHLTVAALVEKNGRFLMVEERPEGGEHVLNQPAGHVEEQESLLAAITREVREETQRHFTPVAVSGLYRWRHPRSGITYLRVVFCGNCEQPDPRLPRDPAILDARWYTLADLRSGQPRLRSPMVLRAIEDYLAGQRLPLDIVREIDSDEL